VTDELKILERRIAAFAKDHGWDQLRTLKDLSLAIGIEAAELQEHFLWLKAEDEDQALDHYRAKIEEELADVLIYCIAFAHQIDADLFEVAQRKLDINEKRFPQPNDD
jgi:dCTP diphosphatase